MTCTYPLAGHWKCHQFPFADDFVRLSSFLVGGINQIPLNDKYVTFKGNKSHVYHSTCSANANAAMMYFKVYFTLITVSPLVVESEALFTSLGKAKIIRWKLTGNICST